MQWPRQYRCFVCDADATIRVFSGTYGGGWPACGAHEQVAITRAMEPLGRIDLATSYSVTAHRVTADEHGWPRMGRPLWTARRRAKERVAGIHRSTCTKASDHRQDCTCELAANYGLQVPVEPVT